MSIDSWFFDGWPPLVRIAAVGPIGYLALIALMRVSGNRTLSKMNAFDFVITVATGSTLASLLVGGGVSLAEGVAALALLVGLQWAVTWLSVRSGAVTKLIKSEPKLLVRDGRMLEGAMRDARVIQSDILQAVREQGIASLDDVSAVVLETDGSFSVIGGGTDGTASALGNVAAARVGE